MNPNLEGGHRRTAPSWMVPVIWATAVALAIAGVVCGALTDHGTHPFDVRSMGFTVVFAAAAVGYVTIGALVVRRAAGHPIGWIFLASGSLFAVGLVASGYAEARITHGHFDRWSAVGSWAYDWTWELASALAVAAIALFPLRRPADRFGRVVLRVIAVYAVVQVVGITLAPGELAEGAHQTNPFGIRALHAIAPALVDTAEVVSWFATVASMGSLLWRYRHADAAVRRQLRWLSWAVAVFLACAAIAGVSGVLGVGIELLPFSVALVGIPVAMGAAILREHLFDIDLILNKVIVYALLVTTITIVYIGVALAARAAFGDSNSVSAVSVAAVVAVTVVTAPARSRLQQFADRVVFGRRSTPYHALADFAEHTVAAGSIHDTAPRLAGLLADATGAAHTVVYVRVDDEFIPITRESVDDGIEPVVPVPVDELESVLQRFDLALPVERRGERLGALALTMPPGTPVRPTERRLVTQLAAQAALSFETLRLTTELTRHAEALTEHAEQLRLSRRRLVEVQDAERQRIGRDLHDGAQQQLIALIAKVMLARSQLGRDPAVADETLQEVQLDARNALTEIREFVHGIFPQILADRGLVVALQQRTSSLRFEVCIDVDEHLSARRLPPFIESAAWFVINEALTNVAKHAGASRVVIRLRETDGLTIDVIDNGIGAPAGAMGNGLTGMSDRVAALGGEMALRSGGGGNGGRGTTVHCSIPLMAEAAR